MYLLTNYVSMRSIIFVGIWLLEVPFIDNTVWILLPVKE